MEGSIFSREDEVDASVKSHPQPAAGGILVLDKHITFASLHSPLPQSLRRDIYPFLLAFTGFVASAAPALWYELQVAWINSGEEQIVDDHQESNDIIPFDTEDSDLATGLVNATAAVAANATKPLTVAELAIKEIPVPADSHFYVMYLLPLLLFFYAIFWLILYWNVKLKIAFRYRDEGGIQNINRKSVSHIRVVPVEHGGKSEICPIVRRTIAANQVETYFYFQKTKYILQGDSTYSAPAAHTNQWFAPLAYPTHETLQTYLDRANQSASLMVDNKVQQLKSTYGENAFDIPLPPFADLFKEHALAPFFVFQIFCVLLWCLDEYWYYSLMTLFMLVTFEATVVKRRLKNLEFLREMRMKPYTVNVYRNGKWTPVPTSELVPHDLISLVRPSNDQYVVPADIVLLTGSVVVNEAMLTGESVPQIKENLENTNDQLGIKLNIDKEHKRSMLFGGTKILLANSPSGSSGSSSGDEASASSLTIKNPPDNGCIGYVLRTGFNTSQGKLVRTILFSSEAVSINNAESLAFIGVLLIFAIAASVYVCIKGLEDENRSRYKLMLNCIMIITSVVPPELPMELSLAVNTSLLHLMKNHIFCTEPFRIPLAGAVDIACFDKTGTLTADEFIVKGIAGVNGSSSSSSSSSTGITANNSDELITATNDLPLATKLVIAGCNSLAFLPDTGSSSSSSSSGSGDADKMDTLIGDPLEKSSLLFIDWSLGRHETACSKSGAQKDRIRILHKYPFSSSLKRMSSIIAIESQPNAPLRVVTKGAAEILHSMFDRSTIPQDYEKIHTRYSQKGCRVLALGYKDLANLRDLPDDRRSLKSLTRDSLESGLTFAGFLILTCPLKKDSLDVITQLKQSAHAVMMISGDHILTCCSVAADLGITTKPQLILSKVANNNSSSAKQSDNFPIEWVRNDETSSSFPFSLTYTESVLVDLAKTYDLCVAGDALEFLTHSLQDFYAAKGEIGRASSTKQLALLVSYSRVFARTSPEQKELIIHWLNSRGLTTMMAGDGTNDVGALSQAAIGVALIGEDAAKAASKNKDKKKAAVGALQPGQKPALTPAQVKAQEIAKIKAAQAQAAVGVAGGRADMLNQKAKLEAQLAELQSQMAEEENTTPRLGDASIASPFTSKVPYITACVDIIRQGRCTLVTTLQMFNILGINCLISAYSMSVLYSAGIKWGDTQMTIASLSIAMFFFFISRSQPLKQLSFERPHKKLFTVYMMLSVLGQFALHMFVLLTAINLADPHTPQTEEHRSTEKAFKPNVLNTVVYLVSTTTNVATFAANYRGRPFMESLKENRQLFKALSYTFGLMMLLASEMMPFLNEFLELHPLPSPDFQLELIGLMLFDVLSTYFYAKFLRKVFAIKPTQQQIADAESTKEMVKVLEHQKQQAQSAEKIQAELKKASTTSA